MTQQRAPAPPSGPICAGIPRVGMHLAEPGDRIVRGLCPQCRAEQGGRK